MIVCTRTVDSLVRREFNKGEVAISSVEAMIQQFALDPTISAPTKECFVIADSDIKNSKILQKLQSAAVTKHPNVKIVYVARGAKSNLDEGRGIDKVLVRPRPETLGSTIRDLVEAIEEKAPIISASLEKPEAIEEWRPSFVQEEVLEERVLDDNNYEVKEFEPEELNIPEIKEEEIEVEEMVRTSELVDQIKQCRKVADINTITREMSASKLIKDIVKSNQQYVSIEDRLKGIREKILNVFADNSIKSVSEKFDKIKALLYDKDYYKAKTNTLIEQRVEEVITTIIEQSTTLLNERLAQLDKALVNVATSGGSIDLPRIQGITEERANILLELTLLDKQVREIFISTDDLANSIAEDIAEDAKSPTGSPLLDAKLRIEHDSVVSDKSLDTIVHILSTCDRTADAFKGALRDLAVMHKKLNKLLDLDKEQIAALTEVIAFLRANKVEDTIIAETLIKKSLRMFVAKEGAGRTVVPYVLSKMKSRENTNVLYVDLTGTSKLADYGEEFYSIENWMSNRYEKEFCAVVGEISNSPESIQRLMVALTKAADYYRVINVVVSPEQEEIIHVMAPDVLVVNYVVDTTRGNLETFKTLIEETKYDNVAQRVIINKCDVQLKPIVERLGIIDSFDVHVTKIPYIPSIIDCSLHKVNPSMVDDVKEGFKEVSKVC